MWSECAHGSSSVQTRDSWNILDRYGRRGSCARRDLLINSRRLPGRDGGSAVEEHARMGREDRFCAGPSCGLTLIHLLSSRLLHLIVYFSLMKPYLTSRRSSSLTSPIPGAWYLYSFARSSMPEVSFTFMHPENVPAGVLHVSVRLSISARSIATLGASSW